MANSKEKYWLNGEGYYDPTAAKAIENENKKSKKSRDKVISNLIDGIKQILKAFDLELIERIKVRDKTTGKEYL